MVSRDSAKLLSAFALDGQSRPAQGNLCKPPLPFGRPTPHRNCLPEIVPWPVGPDTSLFQRQCSDRYAFCAGQNLLDKENKLFAPHKPKKIHGTLETSKCTTKPTLVVANSTPSKSCRLLQLKIDLDNPCPQNKHPPNMY
ncbi:hypothetical protein GOBAR_DD10588 [Gossypium barbadense]|nr:hypothetical protein GOBAR_DD10588 [Gossypium barbadense]